MEVRTDAARRQVDQTITSGGRPVLLATMGAPFDDDAVRFAVDTAVEAGQPLLVVNVTRLEPLSLSVRLGYDALEELTPEVSASVRRCVELAVSLGVRVERLRVRSPRPLKTLLELVAERRPGILVFGPDRGSIGRRVHRRAVELLTERAPCLVWVAPE